MKRSHSGELEEVSTFYKHWLAFQQINRQFESEFGISFTQWYILRWVFQFPGITPGQLSEKTSLHRSSITPLIKRLERKGFLTVEMDAWDKRRHFVAITRSGKGVLDHARRMVRVHIKKATDA